MSSAGRGITGESDPWSELRNQFELTPDLVHMSALLISSHPRPVREAIEAYRREIDESQWAMTAAFEMHQRIGKAAIQERTHAFARQLKDGLREMDHIRLITPMSETLSAGIVSFDVDGLAPGDAVRRLRQEGSVIATVTPYAVRHVLLTPSIRNSPEEVDRALEAIRRLA